MSYPENFEALSLEQLNELIQQFGPLVPLVREVQVRGLQSKLKGLSRRLALLLVNPLAEHEPVDPQAKQIADVIAANRLTDSEIAEVAQFCGEQSVRVWSRAVSFYSRSTAKQATDSALDELLLNAWQRQHQAEAKGQSFTAEEARAAVDDDADSYDEQLRLREFFSETMGIDSPGDLAMWVQSMEQVFQAHAREWPDLDLKGYRVMVKRARGIFNTAQRLNSTPETVARWNALRLNGSMKSQPNMIFLRPDGTEVFGDGEPVLRDKDGLNPRRPMAGFLGDAVRESPMPTDTVLKDMARSAWPDQNFPPNYRPKW